MNSSRPLTFEVGEVVLGLYEILKIHRSGGMGLVYRVHHRVWGIDLAMKSPRPELFRDKRYHAAFVKECETWIRLGLHPHTVSCYYVRVIDEIPRVFAEYVPGGTLSEWIRAGRFRGEGRAPLRSALDIGIQSAWGLRHAHEQGVVHLDVKPANVLLTEEGVAKVTDFGLARLRPTPSQILERSSKSEGLPEGMTPAYCSPEQAAHQSLTPATDIWSLGLTIFEIFNGGLSWAAGQAAEEVLAGYLEGDPPEEDLPPMPEALADLLMHCFRTDPNDRPKGAGEVARRLVKIYEAEIGPYPRKGPRVAEHLAAGLNNNAVSYLDLGRKEDAMGFLDQAIVADPHHPEAVYNRGLLRWRAGEITDQVLVKELEEVQRSESTGWRTSHLLGLVHLERSDAQAAISAFEVALGSGGPPEEIRPLVTRARNALGASCRCLAVIDEHRDRILAIDPTPDGKLLFVATGERIIVHRIRTGEIVRILEGHTDEVRSLATSRDGRWLISGGADWTIRLWQIANGRCRRLLTGHRDIVSSVALSPRSQYVLSGDVTGSLRLWQLAGSRCVRVFRAHEDSIQAVEFGPHGSDALTGSWDRTIRWIDLAKGSPKKSYRSHTDWVDTVKFYPDGLRAFSAGHDGRVLLLDLETGLVLRRFTGHSGPVVSLDVSRDGRFLLTGGHDRTIRLFAVDTGRCLRTLQGHEEHVNCVRFAGDAGLAASSGDDVTVRIWDLGGAREETAGYAISLPSSGAEVVDIGGDIDRRIAAARQALFEGRYDGALKALSAARAVPGYERNEELREMWNEIGRRGRRIGLRGGWRVYDVSEHGGAVSTVRISPDGRRILTLGEDHTVRIHDAATGRPIEVLRGHRAEVEDGDFLPDGESAVTVGTDRTVRLWDLRTGAAVWVAEGHGDWIDAVRASPDGRTVLSAGHDGTIRRWLVSTGEEVARYECEGGPVEALAFSTLGRRFLTGSQDGVVRVWDSEGGQCERCLTGHRDWISSVLFSPGDRLLIAGGWDGTIRIWEGETGAVIRTFDAHPGGVRSLAMSPDGRWLFSGGHDATVRLWDVETGSEKRVFGAHLGPVRSVDVSEDGLLLCSAGEDRTFRGWELDWDYEIAVSRDWEDAARGMLETLLLRHGWIGAPGDAATRTDEKGLATFERLMEEMAARGFAGFEEADVRREVQAILSAGG